MPYDKSTQQKQDVQTHGDPWGVKHISEVGSSAVENFCEVGSRAVAQYSSRNSTAYDLQYGWQNDTANSQNVRLAVEQ